MISDTPFGLPAARSIAGRSAAWLGELAGSLKFRLALACLVLIAASVGVTTSVLLQGVGERTERALFELEYSNVERLSVVLRNRVVMLQRALRSAIGNAGAATFQDAQAAANFLAIKPVLATLFSTSFVVAPDGRLLAVRDEQGVRNPGLSLADRAYFQQTLSLRRPVVSEPIEGRISNEPVIVLTMPVLGPAGSVIGVVGGTLRLSSRDLMADLTQENLSRLDPVQVIIADGQGRVIAHRDREQIMRKVGDQPGLAAAVAQWEAEGRPIEPSAAALHAGGYVVVWAGVAGLDWVVFRVAAEDALLGGLQGATQQAWHLSALVALVGGGLMLLLLLFLLRPLEQLEQRAHALLFGAQAEALAWPDPGGEIGQLSRVLQHVLREREQAEQYNAGLLRKMGSLLRAAPIGIAFSRKHRFDLVSVEFARMFGLAPADLLGQLTRQIYTSDADYAHLVERIPQAFAAQGSFDDELRFVRHDGSTFWGRLQGRPVDPDDEQAGSIWLLTDITREREEREQLTWTASHDALTGVFNRRAFEARLAGCLTQVPRPAPMALLFIDLDRFKQVNDTAGHAAGDQVLIAVAQVLLGRMRGSDVVARLGGDEFAVLLPGCELQAALGIAEQIRQGVEAIDIDWNGARLQVGVSVGVAALDDDVSDVAAALSLADSACYEVKREGRNGVRGGSPVLRLPASPWSTLGH